MFVAICSVADFQGGGWCYSEADCWGRSKGTLGSSHGLPATSRLGGIMGSVRAPTPKTPR